MSAHISECGTYRYNLMRSMVKPQPNTTSVTLNQMTFVMLNPSTADADKDDPTIRRCIGFAEREGCNVLHVVNLFALRATDPAALSKAVHPVGPENDRFLLNGITTASIAVMAWGAHPFAINRAEWLRRELRGRRVFCLGTTKEGHPRHPLYVRNDQPLQEWTLSSEGSGKRGGREG